MRRVVAAALALALVLSLCACGADGTGMGFMLPLDGEPRQLDPQTATDSSSVSVVAALFEGLTRLDAAGEPVDGAASYTLSADGLTYTFTLQESYWSTLSIRGEETPWDEPTRVVADDFLFGLQRAVSPDNQSGTASALYAIQNAEAVHKGELPLTALGVKAVNETTLTITLAAPDDTFPTQLASTPFMPCNRAFFAYTAGRYGLEKAYVLSNGAFSLTAWNHQQSLLLHKNEGYHAADSVLPSAVRFVLDMTDAVASLTAGSLDAAFLPTDAVAAAKEAGVQVMQLHDSVRQLSFNTAVEPLSSVDVRRALATAIEWSTVQVYVRNAGETLADGYIPPDATRNGEAYRNEFNTFTFSTDTAGASEALAQGLSAVYPDDKAPALPQLTLLAAEDDISANLARYLVQSWQKNLKIYCALELVSEATLTARVQSGSYQLALHTTVGGGLSAADNLTAYTTGAANNVTRFSNATFDTEYAAARRGGMNEQKAEAMLYSECPAVPLSFPPRYYGVAVNTEGVLVRPFGGGTYGSAYTFRQAKKFED